MGFTLIELLIMLAIVAVLGAITLPSFSEYVRRSHRVEARSGLLQAAHWMERVATATGAYPDGELPAELSQVPGGRYVIGRAAPEDPAEAKLQFELTATPTGAQKDDRCGTFTLTQSGIQGLRDNTASVADCWNH